jgi:hypothetical protein
VALSIDDLYRLEIKARQRADDLRKDAEACAKADTAEVRAHARHLHADAGAFDMIGDLLVGLQGDWDTLGPLVRAGFIRLRAEFERRKQAAEAAKAEDVAA